MIWYYHLAPYHLLLLLDGKCCGYALLLYFLLTMQMSVELLVVIVHLYLLPPTLPFGPHEDHSHDDPSKPLTKGYSLVTTYL